MTAFAQTNDPAQANGPARTNSSESESPERNAPTRADTNREVIRTYADFDLEAKNYSSAEIVLSKYLAREDQDGILWNMLGLAQVAQQKFAQGCFAFQKAASLLPKGEDRSNALYNYADCLVQGQHLQEGVQVLNRLISEGGQGKTCAEVALDKINQHQIGAGQSLPPYSVNSRGHLRVSGALGFGFDTNVLLLDDLSVNGGVSGQSSAYVSPALQASYWGTLFRERFDSRIMASFTDYLSAAESSYNLAYERIDFLIGSGSFRAGIIQEISYLNRDPFQLYFLNGGVNFQKKMRVDSVTEWDFELPIKYQSYAIDQTADPANVRTGVDVVAKVQWLKIFGSQTRVSSQVNGEGTFTSGDNYKLLGVDWPTQVLVPLLPFELLNTFAFDLGYSDYWKNTQGRHDVNYKVGLGVIKNLSTHLRLSVDFSYQVNSSTLETASYHKQVVGLNLGYDLL